MKQNKSNKKIEKIKKGVCLTIDKEEVVVSAMNFGGVLVCVTQSGKVYGCDPIKFSKWVRLTTVPTNFYYEK